MWKTQRTQNYLPFWSVGFFFGAMGWLINLIPIESFPTERQFWLIDISITLISVSAVTYGFLIRSFQTFNALWFFIAGFVALHWIAYFSSIQIDYGLKMAISPLYVAVCMQIIVCIIWLKGRRFNGLELAAALICQTSVIVHVARAYLYANQTSGSEQALLSVYDIVSYIVLPFVYTITGAALMVIVFNDKEASTTPLVDLKSGMLNANSLKAISSRLLWQCERSEQWVSIITCKVNHLKYLQRHYGHALAEQIMQELAKAVCDEVGDRGYVARIDNKELVILLAMADEVEAIRWGAKLHLLASQLKIINRQELVPVAVSIGHASSCNLYDYDKLRLRAQ